MINQKAKIMTRFLIKVGVIKEKLTTFAFT